MKEERLSVLDQLKGGLIVSCQAPPGSPLDRPEMIAALAAAAERAGAAGVRINRPENIRAVRAAVRIPIIGIFKQYREGQEVYITPDFAAAAAVAQAGADLAALDATERRAGGHEAAERLIAAVRDDLHIPVMADVASLADAVAATRGGASLVATTLFGYTAATRGGSLPNLELVCALARALDTPVVAEGGVQSPEQVAAAFQAGAFAVVVGTAITGIEARTRQFAAAAREAGGRIESIKHLP